jgi:hypothetical protein
LKKELGWLIRIFLIVSAVDNSCVKTPINQGCPYYRILSMEKFEKPILITKPFFPSLEGLPAIFLEGPKRKRNA